MSTSRGTIIAICSTLLAFLVLGLSGSGPEPTPVKAAHTVKSELAPETADAFQRALQASLDESAASTLDAIEAQDEVLARIDSNIAEIAEREAAVEEAAQAAVEEAATKAAELPSPVRRSSTIWNVEGSWNYTTEELSIHLQNVHGLNVDGYGREDMKTMHDNLHNGYSAAGGTVTGGTGHRGTRTKRTYTYTYQQPKQRRSLFGAIFGSKGCPDR